MKYLLSVCTWHLRVRSLLTKRSEFNRIWSNRSLVAPSSLRLGDRLWLLSRVLLIGFAALTRRIVDATQILDISLSFHCTAPSLDDSPLILHYSGLNLKSLIARSQHSVSKQLSLAAAAACLLPQHLPLLRLRLIKKKTRPCARRVRRRTHNRAFPPHTSSWRPNEPSR